nr:MAG TPA: hypothetical protein [Caudoviricetes sp.]
MRAFKISYLRGTLFLLHNHYSMPLRIITIPRRIYYGHETSQRFRNRI